MIFSCNCHIQAIKDGLKTQTRRQSSKYQVGKMYKIQPKRTAKGIPDGKILILEKKCETREANFPISFQDAIDEGGYIPEEYECLYEKLHPKWTTRIAYTFHFIRSREEAR